MSVGRLLRTASHIPPGQLSQRLRAMWRRRRYAAAPTRPTARAAADAEGFEPVTELPRVPDDVLWPDGRDAVERRAADFARGKFVYLNREADFADGVRWRDAGASPLWLYQLQYLGSVADIARTGRISDAVRILGSWRSQYEKRWDPVAWHPYPASLRLVNLCVAASYVGGFDRLGAGTARLVAAHAAYLLRHVEHDVRGNHVIENARALLWAARCLRGRLADECGRVGRAIFDAELPEQILPDGGHFELSPMYHCVVLRNLLEVRELLGPDDAWCERAVDPAIARMGEFLAGIVCPDGDIPLLGDSVRGFGPPPKTLLRLVGTAPKTTLGLTSFPDSGLHVLRGARVWGIFDTGRTCPAYLPAHGQADSLTIEAWVDETRVVADPGVHDYTGPERAWGRSSRAHSTITVDDRDTSEVYGSFRVGGRAHVESVSVAKDEVVASVRPYGSPARLSRSVRIFGEALIVEDWAEHAGGGTVRSRMHLAPGVDFLPVDDVARGGVTGVCSRVADIDAAGGLVRIERGRVSSEFGLLEESKILVQEERGDGARVRWVIGPA